MFIKRKKLTFAVLALIVEFLNLILNLNITKAFIGIFLIYSFKNEIIIVL